VKFLIGVLPKGFAPFNRTCSSKWKYL